MKIAILTQPLGKNYGGILQNYALQQFLLKRGHDVLTLNIATTLYFRRWMQNMAYQMFVLLKSLNCRDKMSEQLKEIFGKKKKYAELFRFIRQQLKLSEKITTIRQLNNYRNFDCYIVGSDQVWRPEYSPDILSYFLNFLPLDNPAMKIAYAASFGISEFRLPEEKKKKCKELAQRFNRISVREDSGIDLCSRELEFDSVLVPDPTFLLSRDDYKSILDKAELSGSGKIVTYILDSTCEKEKIIQDFQSQSGLPILSLLGGQQKMFAVEDWISAISSAGFVITDSFHGTVFSILFQRNFIVVSNSGRGIDRISSLLKIMGLEDRLYRGPSAIRSLSPIDYCKVSKRLEEYRQTGIDFLIGCGF